MRVLSLLSAVAVASAFVIPDQATLESLALEDQESRQSQEHPFWKKVHKAEHFWHDLEEEFTKSAKCAKHRFEEVVESTQDAAVQYGKQFQDAFAGDAWLESADFDLDLLENPPRDDPHHGPRRHEGPPSDGPPHHGPPGKGPKGPKKPHHPPHHGHGPPNQTVYELISKSKYTTKLAAAINEYEDLVELLNGTKANYTVFAPTDKAFEKIPEKAPKPSKEFLKKLLTYHVSTEFYPAGRILASRTIPTALEAEFIGKVAQRISSQISLKGLTLNFYSRVVAIDIFGTNGVIHGIDSLLLPPPKVVDILSLLPGEFSTLGFALEKTGLYPLFNDTTTHSGGTLFAPSNFAFKRLGPRINAFLFSTYGQKYLKALLLYHAADNITLYSDAIYKVDSAETHTPHYKVPKGFIHVDLPTGLEDKSLSIDIARYGRLITIKINGFTRVSVSDGIAADGVIHVVPNVLIPPKTPGGLGVAEDDMDLDEFKARLAPFVEETESSEGFSFTPEDPEL
ncbi:FAS1 domain-containing protein [Exophiala viscosa]|uniref:FAS1 domain-containing protein n=1 Tax=Exophiala viscosa TaxID=2486360 RepID=A0AAN6IE16_9EURO|nr:FAS1 domain-containing protein [Exophiala viscosa]KAI1622453.1 FAS1 domain-containing protein [Exophiala viscosa]